MHRLLVGPLMLAATIGLGLPPANADENPIGKAIENFTLKDYRGKSHSLADYNSGKGVVVAFIGIECPLAKLYVSRLESLSSDYADQGIPILAIDSNRQDSITELAGFAARHKLTVPVLKDPDNKVADMFDAKRTPEVYLLDGDGKICYYGRIDDQYGQHLGENGKRISYQLTEPRRRDLKVAMDQLIAGDRISQPLTEVVGCLIGRVPDVQPQGEITFTKHVAKILNQRCVECHREGEIAPFSLSDYDEVVGWSEMIREVVEEERMPPWHANPEHGDFVNDCRLSKQEKETLYAWIDNGSPEGDPADLPEPPTFVEGWTAGQPDQIVYMSDEPYQVPAEGTVEYEYFTVDPGWTEDKWITAAEARPGNRSVVHHILCFIQSDLGSGDFDESVAIGWAPGTPAQKFEDNTAIYVPARAKILFQLHYTPNGTEATDRSYLGLQFADPEEVEYLAAGGDASAGDFLIPAGAADHEVTSKHVFEQDQYLLSMLPHMHLRGKSFRYTAHYPDGSSEILLDVPRYDFNWQLRYQLKEPKLMKKGTEIHCVAHFDNSAENMTNPDPTVDVTWGDQTWEEMMIGFFTTREADKITREELDRREQKAKQIAAMYEAQAKIYIGGMDKNGNGTLSVDEVPEDFKEYFHRLDNDDNGEIDAKEASLLVRQFSEEDDE